MSDAASLQNLHDIVTPGPVDWWPPAPGWYVLATLAAAALLVLGWKGWQRWRRNRYRGQALRELARIRRLGGNEELRQLPALLKRAALSAWPRDAVASLVGPDWHRFLDQSGQMECFSSEVGQILDRLAHAPASGPSIAPAEALAALEAAERWLKQHRAPREGA